MLKRVSWGCVLALALSASAGAQNVIVNGGFESGGLTGWTRNVWSASNGDLRAATGTTGFLSGLPTVGANTGSFYALTDQRGPGAYELWQSFSLSNAASSATLSFYLSASNRATTIVGSSLNPFGGFANQHITVDLFSGSPAAFSTGGLQNFYLGSQLGVANPYGLFQFDVTSLLNAPGTYTLRFAEVDNWGYHHMAVDDVSLDVSTVPEPTTFVLFGAGMAALAIVSRRRRA